MTAQSLKDRLLAMNMTGNFARCVEMWDIYNTLMKLAGSPEHLDTMEAFVQHHIELTSEEQTRTSAELQAMTTILQGIYQQHRSQIDLELQILSQRIDALENATT